MSRQYDEAQEERALAQLDAHVSRELGIPEDVLAGYSYRIDPIVANDDSVLAWRVLWDGRPPPGVRTEGSPSHCWTDIAILHQPDVDTDLPDPALFKDLAEMNMLETQTSIASAVNSTLATTAKLSESTLDAPVTRAELLGAIEIMTKALTSQSMFNATIAAGAAPQVRARGLDALSMSHNALMYQQELLKRWLNLP